MKVRHLSSINAREVSDICGVAQCTVLFKSKIVTYVQISEN